MEIIMDMEIMEDMVIIMDTEIMVIIMDMEVMVDFPMIH